MVAFRELFRGGDKRKADEILEGPMRMHCFKGKSFPSDDLMIDTVVTVILEYVPFMH